MTLNQWLTCTDPAAMIDALGDQADELRKLLWAEECLRIFREATGFQYADVRLQDWREWVEYFSTRFRDPIAVSRTTACDLIRCLWPPPMMERERVECENCKGSAMVWNRLNLACDACDRKGYTLAPLIDPRYRTPLVMDLAMRARGERRPVFSGRSINGQNIHSFHFAKNRGEVEIMHTSIRLKVGDRFDLVLDEEDRIGRYKKHWYGLLVTGATHAYQFTTDELSGTPSTGPNPEVMPILADSLMDSDCDCEEILNHLRCGVHVPGHCWVVDAILSNQ